MDEDNNFIDHIDDVDLFDNDPVDTSTDSSSDSDSDNSDDDNDNNRHTTVSNTNAEDILENERIRQEIYTDTEAYLDENAHINPVDQHQPEDLFTEKPIDSLPQHRYSTRSKGPAERPLPFRDGRTLVNTALKSMQRLQRALFHATLTIKQKNKFGVYSNLTVRQAIDKYGNPAREAVMNELRQLIKLKVLKFLQPDLLDPTTLKGILPSKMFVKPKFDPDGEFDKIKARLVGGGHRQKRYLYSETETSSPTIHSRTNSRKGGPDSHHGRRSRCIPASIHDETSYNQDRPKRVSNISGNVP